MNLIKSIKLTALMIALFNLGVVAQPGDGDYTSNRDHYISMVSLHKTRPMITEGWTYRSAPEVEVEAWMLDEDYLSCSVVPVEPWMLDENWLDSENGSPEVKDWMLDDKYLAEKVSVEPWMLDTKYLK